MAAKSNAQLTADIISVITGQTTPESITPITHGALEKDIVDSFYNNVDTPLNRTQTFADATARGLAVPDFIGQNGTQLDTNTSYISSGLVAGNWRLLANTQTQSDTYAVAGGTDTYTITLSPALTTYAAGNSFNVLFTNANSSASSLNVNSLGAKGIKKYGNVDLVAGDIQAGSLFNLTYDGTNFQLTGSMMASSQTEVAAPAGVTTSDKMFGLAGTITPVKSGKFLIMYSAEYTSDTTASDTTFTLRTGTGSAPANGAASAGTARQIINRRASSTTLRIPISSSTIVSPLTPGTAYWIDISAHNGAAGTVTLFNVVITTIEI